MNFRKGKYMESNFIEEEKTLIFKIAEEIDEHSAEKIRRKADYEIEKYIPNKVIFDFDKVTFMDSAGIGLVIGRYKFINMLGGKLEIANLSPSVERIFKMSGLLRIIHVTKLV